MSDPYRTLGVTKGANAAEIKLAFRNLAKKNHPDQNPDDPNAKDQFAKINNAYDVLGDVEKRGQFDRGEIDAAGHPIHPGYSGGGGGGFSGFGRGGAQQGGGSSGQGFGAEEIIKEMFGGRGGFGQQTRGGFGQQGAGPGRGAAPKGEDVEGKVAVTLEQVVAGQKVSVTLGDGRTVAVSLPKGVKDSQTIRLKGQGSPSPYGGASGDAKIDVKFINHPVFKVDGKNLRYEAPIHLHEAYLGSKVQVPTLSGRINLTVPPKSNSGTTMRVPGKGLPGKSKAGDLLVTFQIHFPDQAEPELETLMAKWASEGRTPLETK